MVNGERVILHCDCNSFFASVECLYHPEYRSVPMAVCGDPESRHGIILAKNELAKKYHIQTAETIWQARQKCPQLVLAPAHHDLYELVSQKINEIYQRYTDLVEPFSIDESWLDVTGSQQLFGNGQTIADELRRVVKKETGVSISVGVSFNKTFSKLGSDYKKPDATTVISFKNYRDIVFPLPVETLLYVGKNARETLRRIGIHTIGELAGSSPKLLESRLGKLGIELYQSANGSDDSPVKNAGEQREVKSVGNSITFRRNLLGEADIRVGMEALADSVAARLRRHGLKCGTVQVVIKNPSLQSISRQKALPLPTFLSSELAQAGLQLIAANWNMKAPIRMLSLTGVNLFQSNCETEQLSLFNHSNYQERRRKEDLATAMDHIREKYGTQAVSTAGLLHNDLGLCAKD